MKFLIAILSALCSLLTVAQNSYRVLKVEGCIRIIHATDCLSKDVMLNGDESFSFDAISSFAVLMGRNGEIVSIKAPDTTGFYNGRELDFSFSEAVMASRSIGEKGQNRGTAGQQVVKFDYFFGSSQFTVIGDEARFGVNPLIYPINKEKFLVLHYKLDTSNVSKRLGFKDQVIRIQKNRLNEFRGKDYKKEKIENAALYYFAPANKSTELLATFDLVFINPEKLKAEFDEVYMNLPNKETIKSEELESTFVAFFENSYGKTEPQSLQFVIDEYISKLSKN